MVNKIRDDIFQNIPWWHYNGAVVTSIDYQNSCQDTDMYHDIVKGSEHATIKEGGFFDHNLQRNAMVIN